MGSGIDVLRFGCRQVLGLGIWDGQGWVGSFRERGGRLRDVPVSVM